VGTVSLELVEDVVLGLHWWRVLVVGEDPWGELLAGVGTVVADLLEALVLHCLPLWLLDFRVLLWWRLRRGTSAALEVFKTSLELLAVVALSNAVLNAAALSEIGNLSPILIWVRRAAEGTAGAVVGIVPWSGSCR